MIRDVHPGSGSRISDPGSRGQKGTGSQIPDPGSAKLIATGEQCNRSFADQYRPHFFAGSEHFFTLKHTSRVDLLALSNFELYQLQDILHNNSKVVKLNGKNGISTSRVPVSFI